MNQTFVHAIQRITGNISADIMASEARLRDLVLQQLTSVKNELKSQMSDQTEEVISRVIDFFDGNLQSLAEDLEGVFRQSMAAESQEQEMQMSRLLQDLSTSVSADIADAVAVLEYRMAEKSEGLEEALATAVRNSAGAQQASLRALQAEVQRGNAQAN